ncbi:MAG TPA: STAS domain-containing protein [Thermomonospora sp.]|nr:STAS domain-containing protein [Thermomonospora sp.]
MKDERRTTSKPAPRPEAALRIHVHRTGGDLFVRPAGDLGARTADLLREPLTAALRETPCPRVVLDLSRVRMADRFGLGVLVALWSQARRSGARLILARPNPDLVALLADTGLDRHLHACATLELAAAGVPLTTRPGHLLPLDTTPAPDPLPSRPKPQPPGPEALPPGPETLPLAQTRETPAGRQAPGDAP